MARFPATTAVRHPRRATPTSSPSTRHDLRLFDKESGARRRDEEPIGERADGGRAAAGGRARNARGRYLLDRERVLGPLMLLPAVIYIVALVGVPLVLAIAYAFSDVTVGDQSIDWVGLRELPRRVWNDRPSRTALRNTILFTIVSQIVVLVLGEHPGDGPRRRLSTASGWSASSILLPWTTPIALGVDRLAVDASIAVYSPIDCVLRELGLLGPGNPWGPMRNMYWLAETDKAQLSVLLVHVWRTLPLATVILLAGLTLDPAGHQGRGRTSTAPASGASSSTSGFRC